ncbi:MAG: hypothetical protein ACPGIA_08195 [Luteolibacter sp.]
MKPLQIIRIVIIGFVSLMFCGCGLPFVGAEYAAHGVKNTLRSDAPDPESKWNKYGWWKRISDDPPSYIPKDYPVTAPRTRAHGDWFVDQRDGKRLFVPTGDDVLSADARVVTTVNVGEAPIRFQGQSSGENLKALIQSGLSVGP